MLGEILKEVGFTDIVENPDGTYDATREGHRYKGLCVKDMTSLSIGSMKTSTEIQTGTHNNDQTAFR